MSVPLRTFPSGGPPMAGGFPPTETLGSRFRRMQPRLVEDYPAGLPRFAGLIGAHPAFTTCRGFSVVRARILLLKQDKVSRLEERLNEVDGSETRPFFLGSSRRDKNPERARILQELDIALEDLDKFIQQSHQSSELPSPPKHIVASLQNWVNGNGSVSKEETRWLEYESDLLTTATCSDGAVNLLQPWIES